jgi:hypothetical protein
MAWLGVLEEDVVSVCPSDVAAAHTKAPTNKKARLRR